MVIYLVYMNGTIVGGFDELTHARALIDRLRIISKKAKLYIQELPIAISLHDLTGRV